MAVGEDGSRNPATTASAKALANSRGYADPILVVVDPSYSILSKVVNHFYNLQPNQPISSSLPLFTVIDPWMQIKMIGNGGGGVIEALAVIEELTGEKYTGTLPGF